MGLITKEVEVGLNPNNIKHFESLNYEMPRKKNKWGRIGIPKGTKILVKVEDLSKGSNVKVDLECDNCKKELKNIQWDAYLKCVHEDGKYYCHKCAINLFGTDNQRKTNLKNKKSFEQYCTEINRIDLLDRWDYELNILKPNEITYGSEQYFYFKCPKELHKSELKKIKNFTRKQDTIMECNQCNSFAQFGIDNIDKDFLEKYWDYEKNNKLRIDPWLISYGSDTINIWIKCQDIDYHGSYNTIPKTFIKGHRCSYCNTSSGKVHPLDSLGKVLEDKGLLHLWSKMNKKSPYEYAPWSKKDVGWKCPEGKHEDYSRNISDSNICNFRCPDCQYSKGETQIDKILTQLNIPHNSQYKFNNLKGVNNGLLKFDIPVFWDVEKTKLRILFEYDGEQHFRPICFNGISMERAIENFKQTQISDKMKNLYCAENNIQLIRIPYWEFNNIEKYLKYYLIDNNEFDY